jgi:hypothetical protein
MAPFTVKFIFFFLNFLVYFNFMLVARKWPQYVNHWENAERKFMELQILQYQNLRLKPRIQKIFVLVTLVAFSKYMGARKPHEVLNCIKIVSFLQNVVDEGSFFTREAALWF